MSASSTELPASQVGRRVRLRRRLRLVAAGGVLVLGALAAEVALRLFSPQPGPYAGLSLYVPDPDPAIGYRLRPGLVAQVRWSGGGEMEVRINSHGMRDRERPREKSAGARRVLVLGDSFAYGAVPLEDGFPARLEALLGPGHEVWNAGVPGWATREEAAWFAREGRGLEPDAVVVAFFLGNDLEENQTPRRQALEGGELVAPGRSWWRDLRNRSHLYRLLKALPERLSCGLSGDSPAARHYHAIERKRLRVCAPGAAEQGFAEGWRVAAEGLRAIRDAAAPRPVVVLAIPDEVQVDPALLQAVCARGGDDPQAYQLDAPQARLAAVCAELGLPLLDPLAELRARTARGEPQYLPLDSHWNAAGNQLAAERLAGALRPLLAR